MSHPIHLVRRFENKVQTGHYKRMGEEAADSYRKRSALINPYERLAQVYATKCRLSDKLALIREIVSEACGVPDLTDDDMMSVLVGWAASERKVRG